MVEDKFSVMSNIKTIKRYSDRTGVDLSGIELIAQLEEKGNLVLNYIIEYVRHVDAFPDVEERLGTMKMILAIKENFEEFNEHLAIYEFFLCADYNLNEQNSYKVILKDSSLLSPWAFHIIDRVLIPELDALIERWALGNKWWKNESIFVEHVDTV